MHAYQPERLEKNKKPSAGALGLFRAHPGLFCGALVSLCMTSAVLANAIWYQPGKHPSPLFSTRSVDVVKPVGDAAAAEVAQNKASSKKGAGDATPELMKEIQTALSVRGYYAGKPDGVYGPQTSKAIDQFQRDHSLTADGVVTVRLLTEILLSASSRPSEVPLPKPQQVAEKKPQQSSPQDTAEIITEDGLVARIQSGLKAYGYDDLIVDGKMGQHTATAIQRFQLDYGMKITGEPSKKVLLKLQEIGAYKRG